MCCTNSFQRVAAPHGERPTRRPDDTDVMNCTQSTEDEFQNLLLLCPHFTAYWSGDTGTTVFSIVPVTQEKEGNIEHCHCSYIGLHTLLYITIKTLCYHCNFLFPKTTDCEDLRGVFSVSKW